MRTSLNEAKERIEQDGTNRANLVMASSTVGTFTYSTNNTFTAKEPIRIDIG